METVVPVSACANDPDRHGDVQWAWRHLLSVKKGVAIDVFDQEVVSQAVQEKLLANVDAQLLRLESAETIESIRQRARTDWADEHNSVE